MEVDVYRRPTPSELAALSELICAVFASRDYSLNNKSVYPLIRMYLHFFYKSNDLVADSNKLRILKNLKIERSERLIDAKPLVVEAEGQNYENQIKSKDDLCVFICDGVSRYTSPYLGKTFDQYFDPVIHSLPENFSYLKIDLRNIAHHQKDSLYYSTLYDLSTYSDDAAPFYSFRFNEIAFGEVNQLLGFWGINKTLDANQFINSISSRLKSFRIWFNIFSQIKPSIIFVRCFYSPSNIGAVMAARHLKIKLVDLQHGPINRNHPVYCGWPSLLQEEFVYFPSEIWAWDEFSASSIQTHNEGVFASKVRVVGNQWGEFLSRHLPDVKIEKSVHKPTILLSLGYADSEFPDFIFEMLSKLPKVFRLWIRRHPADDRGYGARFVSRLQSVGINDFEIQQASLLPLPLLLRGVDLVICHYSGVVIEALNAGVPILTTSERYSDLLANSQQDSPKIQLINKSSDLSSLIKRAIRDQRTPNNFTNDEKSNPRLSDVLNEVLGDI